MTSQPARSFGLRMGLFFGGYIALNGVYFPYYPLWLAYTGLTPVEISICLSATSLVRIAVMSGGAALADKMPSRRFAVALFSIGCFLAFLPVGLVHGLGPILLITMAAWTFWNIMTPPSEALALDGVRRFGLDYGRMRLWGSVAFILWSFFGGLVLARFGPASVYWMVVVILAINVVASLNLPHVPRAAGPAPGARRRPMSGFRDVLARPAILIAILVNALVQASHTMLYNFGSIYWDARGIGSVEIGVLWTVGTIAEISAFAFSRRAVGKLGPYWLMIVGASGAVLRWGLFALAPDFTAFLPLQLLHAASYAACFLALQLAIAANVPDEQTGAVQGVSYTFSAAAYAIGNLSSGFLYEGFGPNAFLAMAAPPLLGLVLLLAGRRRMTGGGA